ncbi:DUF3153 domain-containing protein [Leptolyngbya sp. FACHB-261]|uniref:DUF3153 domain-containing protein n=1 Tax=Leptolyngbya sp. FACHB-261 TaxID=2692806 RepID=UPI0016833253|nr:DUF3153 domain-containing protein [Leptolyngbya sp. FACHB-261]MBD2103398.1 DUF3153 domain-containing protein [Leptolyngbya sp. FACHB-261]
MTDPVYWPNSLEGELSVSSRSLKSNRRRHNPLAQGWRWLKLTPILLLILLSLLLGGCVQADLGIEFYGTAGGRIVEHVRLSERLINLNGSSARQLLDDLQSQVRSAGGRSQRLSERELELTLPFRNGPDLKAKLEPLLDRALAGLLSSSGTRAVGSIGSVPRSHVELRSANLILATLNHLDFDLDLRQLGVATSDGALLLTPGTLVDLEFKLSTPSGAQSAQSDQTDSDGRQLVWTLTPGSMNHLEADFWLPSPLGIGAVVIAGLMGAGYALKRRLTSNTVAA